MSANHGTLMWVGSVADPCFATAFKYCQNNVAQIAVRRDVSEAAQRGAMSVRWILLAKAERDQQDLDQLARQYPEARLLTVLGRLCEGTGPGFGRQRINWYSWQHLLPGWLEAADPKTAQQPPSSADQPAHDSVAIVAASYAAAEPLLDLASSCGAAAVWCRRERSPGVRNFDVCWWDDSAAGPTTYAGWKARLRPGADGRSASRHAWIVNSPRQQQIRAALDAGVTHVVGKPDQIETLLDTLGLATTETPRVTHLPLRAA